MVGSTLGPYKIIEQLGAGGMGEVYLGEDTRLGRNVAIKVLPAEFASDPERLARFEQEARAAAALNHPHIAVVHDVGAEPDDEGHTTHFMVQEYLEGQSLRELLDKGALPLDKALNLAAEIGEALVAAHKAGIVHRDLKPDNIFVTQEGHAKVLDFGLAKLVEVTAPAGSELSMSPTMLGTMAGQVMGTAGYMAPEQINGEDVDHRADLFAFGCVLYGMATGRQAFDGKNVHETLGRILSNEPAPILEANESLPPELQRIVRKLLSKDADRRYQTAGDLTIDLRQLQEDLIAGVAPTTATSVSGEPPGASRVSWALSGAFGLLLLATGIFAAWWAFQPSARPAQYLSVDLSPAANFTRLTHRSIAISPTGSHIAFIADARLWIRPIDERRATPVHGVVEPRELFFSHDGTEIGFHADNRLWSVPTSGGTPRPVADVGPLRGATWGEDGGIYFAGAPPAEAGRTRLSRIYRVPEIGGAPVPVVTLEAGEFAGHPELLPGGEWLLFAVSSNPNGFRDAKIVAKSLVTDDPYVVVVPRGTAPRYLSTGHLVFGSDTTLWATPLSPESSFEADGTSPPTPLPVVEGVRAFRRGVYHYDVSREGDLVYIPGPPGTDRIIHEMMWVDLDSGEISPLGFPPATAYEPRLSPDDPNRIVLQVYDGIGPQIWLYTIDRMGTDRLTSGDARNTSPVWSHDGSEVYFASDRQGDVDIWKIPVDGSGPATSVWIAEGRQIPDAITKNGDTLLFTGGVPGTGNSHIFKLALNTPDAEPVQVTTGPFVNMLPSISPNGRFVAYESNKDDATKVYVVSIDGGASWPVSGAGGRYPHWSPRGDKLYYFEAGKYFSVDVRTDPEFIRESAPVELDLRIGAGANDFFPVDDQTFLMRQFAEGTGFAAPTSAVPLVVNWFEALKQQVPSGGLR